MDHRLSVLTVAQPDYPVCLTSQVILHQLTEQTTRLTLEHGILSLRSLPSVYFVYSMELKFFYLKANNLSQPICPLLSFCIHPIVTNPEFLMSPEETIHSFKKLFIKYLV